MKTNKKIVSNMVYLKIDVKLKLSALWVTLMLFYIYADIVGFYALRQAL